MNMGFCMVFYFKKSEFTVKEKRRRYFWEYKGAFTYNFIFYFHLIFLLFNYKTVTLFSICFLFLYVPICFLFSKTCKGNRENKKKLFLVFRVQNFKNRKQNENHVIIL